MHLERPQCIDGGLVEHAAVRCGVAHPTQFCLHPAYGWQAIEKELGGVFSGKCFVIPPSNALFCQRAPRKQGARVDFALEELHRYARQCFQA